MWKNNVEWDRPQMAIWHMRISRRLPKATTNTQSLLFDGNNSYANALNVTLQVHCLSC